MYQQLTLVRRRNVDLPFNFSYTNLRDLLTGTSLAQLMLSTSCSFMKLNRMRPTRAISGTGVRFQREWPPPDVQEIGSIDLDRMPAPRAIEKISPDRIIEDILVATLSRVQSDSSPEIAAAAEKYISALRRND